MRVSRVILIMAMLLITVPGVLAMNCADLPNFDSLVCGSAPNSALGYGAVDVCGICYPCGADDGVCPEDFYSSGQGRGSCRFCPDPDCGNPIQGYVEDSNGNPVSGATVVAIYGDDREDIATTDGSGFYQASVRSGFVRLFVDFEDFDSNTIHQDISRLTSTQQIDFTGGNALEAGSCRSDCTNTFGNRCQASCGGVNGCSYASYQVAIACDDKEPGTKIFLDDNTYFECCSGATTVNLNDERFVANPSFDTTTAIGAEELVTYVQRSRSSGEGVNIHVVVWDEE